MVKIWGKNQKVQKNFNDISVLHFKKKIGPKVCSEILVAFVLFLSSTKMKLKKCRYLIMTSLSHIFAVRQKSFSKKVSFESQPDLMLESPGAGFLPEPQE